MKMNRIPGIEDFLYYIEQLECETSTTRELPIPGLYYQMKEALVTKIEVHPDEKKVKDFYLITGLMDGQKVEIDFPKNLDDVEKVKNRFYSSVEEVNQDIVRKCEIEIERAKELRSIIEDRIGLISECIKEHQTK